MAEGLNRVMLLGNLGADPELRMTSGGNAKLSMRLATTESYVDRNKVRQERTDWHNVILWGRRAEALGKFLTKGSRLFVEGRISTRSYDDRDGNKKYVTEVIATNVILAGSGGGGGRGAPRSDEGPPPVEPEGARGGYDEAEYGGGNDDDIPF
jgi:single-strand DNA-binding protein